MSNEKNQNWHLPFRYVIGIMIIVAFVALLLYAPQAVRALVIAGFVAYLISPGVTFLMERTGLARAVAVNIVYFATLIVLVGVPAVLTPIFFDEIQIVARDLLNLAAELRDILTQPVQFGGWVFHFEQLGEGLAQLEDTVLRPLPKQALALLETTSLNILWFLVIIVSVHLFMTEWPNMREWMIQLAPQAYAPDMRELYRRIRNVWMAYLRGQLVLMFIVGVVFTVVWLALGIPGALVLGVLAGLLTLVPDVGPFVASALVVGVALLEGSSWIPLSNFFVAGIVALVYVVLINLKNFFLRPIIIGRSVHMNEGMIFIAIMIATIRAGILGALLVVPVLASAVVIMKYLWRRVSGLSAFADDGSTQFAAPPNKIRKLRRLSNGSKDKRKREP